MNSPPSLRLHRVTLHCLRIRQGVALLGLTMALAGGSCAYATDTRATVSAERRAALVTLVRQDCGSCHGLTLQGGLGPALLPANLKDKPTDYLKTAILYGLPSTAMPPWQRFLSETEVDWIVFHLKKGFPGEP